MSAGRRCPLRSAAKGGRITACAQREPENGHHSPLYRDPLLVAIAIAIAVATRAVAIAVGFQDAGDRRAKHGAARQSGRPIGRAFHNETRIGTQLHRNDVISVRSID